MKSLKSYLLSVGLLGAVVGAPVYSYDSVIEPIQMAQASKYRSEREVINWVEHRYNAKVLKIKFKPKKESYKVRVLLPGGKVKQLVVSAIRQRS